jgi:sugar phosphate isomerase/epimerase
LRFRHPNGETVHLAYCSNVHQAEDVDGVLGQLDRFAGPTREALGWPRLGVGLWLAAEAAAALAGDAALRGRLRDALASRGLEVVTFNGFPYAGFHDEVVKRAVYRPDWADPRRAAYTRDLATILADLLPDDVTDGSISTLPLGWREWWDEAGNAVAARALADLVGHLDEIAARTGKQIRVGLEPEPGCTVETIAQAVTALDDTDADRSRIGVCLDACHLAV